MALRARSVIELLISAKDAASNKIKGITGSLTSLAKTAKIAGAALIAGFGAKLFSGGISSAADFEKALDRIQAVTRSSADEMKLLEQAANEAGTTTKFTATEAAGALENLARSGLSASESVKVLPATLSLATAESLELAEAADFITKSLAQFNLGVEETNRVVDVLVATSQSANTNVQGVGAALADVGVVAQQSGLTIEETAAAIGTLANAGIEGQKAGVALRNILSQLADPASTVRRELSELGIQTGDFNTVIEKLSTSTKDTSRALLAFGREPAAAIRTLVQNNDQLGTLASQFQNVAGRADEAAKVMSDNLQGATTRLSSAWDALSRTVSRPFIGPITSAINGIAGFVQRTSVFIGQLIVDIKSLGGAAEQAADQINNLGEDQQTQKIRALRERLGEVSIQLVNTADNIKRARLSLEQFAKAGDSTSAIVQNLNQSIENQTKDYDALSKTYNEIIKQIRDELNPAIEETAISETKQAEAAQKTVKAQKEKLKALLEVTDAEEESSNARIQSLRIESITREETEKTIDSIERKTTTIKSQIPFWDLLNAESQNALKNIILGTNEAIESNRGLADQVGGVGQKFVELADFVQRLSSRRILTPELIAQVELYSDLADEIRKVEAAQSKLTDEFAEGTLTVAELNQIEREALNNIRLLDASTLQALRSQVASVRREMESLREAAEATRQSLEEQLLALQGDEDALRRLRLERQRLDIQDQLNRARSFGDEQAINDLQQSLSLLQAITTEQEKQARLATKALPAPTPAPSPTPTGSGLNGSAITSGGLSGLVPNFFIVAFDERQKDALARDVRRRLGNLNRLNG